MHHNALFARNARDWGIHVTADTREFLPKEYKTSFSMACDAQPALATVGNAGIPIWMTLYQDPEAVRILQAPNAGADIYGERKMGDWTTHTAMFNVIENTGEVSTYGDWNTNGRSDVNFQYPQRQSYLFQTIVEYGDLEIDRAGEAKLSLVSELQVSAAKTLDKFSDLVYHNGVSGLQCYGMMNDPSLTAALTPVTKAAAGFGTKWVNNYVVGATANEVMQDVQSMFALLVQQSQGYIKINDPMTLVMAPQSMLGLTATNIYGKTAREMIDAVFPNIRYVQSPRFATGSGNLLQLIADSFDGMKTGFCAFNEKMRDHSIVRGLSGYTQKKTSGSFGAIIRYPLGVAQMLGV